MPGRTLGLRGPVRTGRSREVLQTQLNAEADEGPDLSEHGSVAFNTQGHGLPPLTTPHNGDSLGGLRGSRRSTPQP